jgi:uncharacterized protein (DUF2249 family)
MDHTTTGTTHTTTGTTHVDVISVAPKDRFETIMAAYDGLPGGGVLELTVDHDPSCMYYTLRATRGEASFAFDYLERGPETWRVRVRKRTG